MDGLTNSPDINEEDQKGAKRVSGDREGPRRPELVSVVAVKTTPRPAFLQGLCEFLGQIDEKAAIKGLESAAGMCRGRSTRITRCATPPISVRVLTSIQYGAKISKMIADINKGDQ
jgi:ribosome-binding factor A